MTKSTAISAWDASIHLSSRDGEEHPGAYTYYWHKWFDKKINVTIKNRRRREKDSWLSNELSNMMEVSILCCRKVYGTTAAYYISLFKTIIDARKDLEEWIAVKIQWKKGS